MLEFGQHLGSRGRLDGVVSAENLISQYLDKILYIKFHDFGTSGNERLEFNSVSASRKEPLMKRNKALFMGPKANRRAIRKVTFRTGEATVEFIL